MNTQTIIPTLLLVLFVNFTNTTRTQSDWCAALKNLGELVAADPEKLKGELLHSGEWAAFYKSLQTLPGANTVELNCSPGGTMRTVNAYYATGADETEGEKAYKELLAQFKACFPSAGKIQYPHEASFNNEAWWAETKRGDISIVFRIGKSYGVTSPHHEVASYVRVEIELY